MLNAMMIHLARYIGTFFVLLLVFTMADPSVNLGDVIGVPSTVINALNEGGK